MCWVVLCVWICYTGVRYYVLRGVVCGKEMKCIP